MKRKKMVLKNASTLNVEGGLVINLPINDGILKIECKVVCLVAFVERWDLLNRIYLN